MVTLVVNFLPSTFFWRKAELIFSRSGEYSMGRNSTDS